MGEQRPGPGGPKNFGEAVQTTFSQYALFSGRARRSQYWYFVLFYVIVLVVAAILDGIIGTYPLSVDPLLIYFLETTTRHMAGLAHGSPDYIRNRIKSALRQGGAVVAAPDGGRMVILSPFLNDRNARRMGGFETMTLVVSLAPDAHAPIRALQAAAPAAGYKLDIRGGKP